MQKSIRSHLRKNKLWLCLKFMHCFSSIHVISGNLWIELLTLSLDQLQMLAEWHISTWSCTRNHGTVVRMLTTHTHHHITLLCMRSRVCTYSNKQVHNYWPLAQCRMHLCMIIHVHMWNNVQYFTRYLPPIPYESYRRPFGDVHVTNTLVVSTASTCI